MRALKIRTDPRFAACLERYPSRVRRRIQDLRQLIHETARELDGVSELEETLKWGEPSFVTKRGSTLRIDWKEHSPDRYAVYFNCNTKLVPTSKQVFGSMFTYEKDRAIVFGLDDAVPVRALKQCIAASLNYHIVKGLENLGVE